MSSPILFILGPTASGKSEIAHEIAKQSGASIFCMDSMQVYRGLKIGVGKPTLAEKREVTYRGLDLVEMDQPFDVAAYLKEASAFLREQQSKGKPIVIVGGTGLYYRALTQGLSPIPEIDPAIRLAIEALTLTEMQSELQREDPDLAGRIDLQNPRRLIRALEVKRGTGVPLSEWQRRNEPPLISEFTAFFLNRENLRERIDRRAVQMIQQGWREEVEELVEEWGEERVTKLAAIGYNHLTELLKGTLSEERAIEQIQHETWQYARRQLTWFRKESNYISLNLNVDTPAALVIESIRLTDGLPLAFSTHSASLVQDSSCC